MKTMKKMNNNRYVKVYAVVKDTETKGGYKGVNILGIYEDIDKAKKAKDIVIKRLKTGMKIRERRLKKTMTSSEIQRAEFENEDVKGNVRVFEHGMNNSIIDLI